VTRHGFISLLFALTLSGCSDSAAPTPSAFSAQLSGARAAPLGGVAIAEVSFVEEYPDHRFVIRMHASTGDTLHTIALRCRGDEPPEPGSHTLNPSGDDCLGTYSRLFQPIQGSVILLDGAEAASGQVTVGPPEADQVPGAFSFSGHLVQDGDTLGTVQVSGSFSAERRR
jgi:hypothetical protein